MTEILPPGNASNPHEKIIVLIGKVKIMIVHNLNLAPNVSIAQGETITFCGTYQPDYGILNWTHFDPQGQHDNGFLYFNGLTYDGRH